MKKTILKFTTAAVLAIAWISHQSSQAQDAVQTTTTTTNAGTISEFSPETITVRTEGVAEPVRYSYTKSTTYVDENGTPVSMEVVKSGLPVTVYYAKEGDNLVASKVIVRRTVNQPAPASVEESRETTTTTTTTNK